MEVFIMTDYEVVEKIEEHMEAIMDLLDIKRTPSNEGTPKRVAKMWATELFKNRNNRNIEELDNKMKVFPNEYENDVIIMRDIDFNSMCEHHWLPFSGKVTVAYVPDKNIIGLSKIPRVVRYFSKQPTLQEKLCKDIGDYLFKKIEPQVIYVFATSTHQCVKCRGAESDCKTVTQYSVFDSMLTGEDLKILNDVVLKRVGVL